MLYVNTFAVFFSISFYYVVALSNCPDSSQPYINPITNQHQSCLPQQPNGCPTGYFCWYSSTSLPPAQYYCCGNSNSNSYCPVGQKTYNGPSNQPTLCNPSIPTCPTGFTCQRSSQNQYYCCGINTVPSTTSYCPMNTQPLINLGQPTRCTPTYPNCPVSYTCSYSSSLAQHYCCSSTVNPTTSYCPNNKQPYLVNNQPMFCNPANTACPSGYSCMYSTTGNANYCCQSSTNPGTIGYCPTNQQPNMNNMNQPVQCIPTSPSCIVGYSCVYSATFNRYYCCSSTSTAYCPSNQQPLMNTLNQPIQCNVPALPSCTVGYSCLYSASLTKYYCCKSTNPINVCPASSSVLVNSYGQPQQCMPGTGVTCPINYYCNTIGSITGKYYCCSSSQPSSPTCSNGQQLYKLNNQIQYCVLGSQICPSGYTCMRQTGSSSTTGICCSGSCSKPVQPTDRITCNNPYRTPVTNVVQTCNPTINGCPSSHKICVYEANLRQFACCGSCDFTSYPTATPTPPPSEQSSPCVTGYELVKVTKNEPLKCPGPTSFLCPIPNKCQQQTSSGTYYCCRHVTQSYTCSNGESSSQTCISGSSSNCSPGYNCQRSTTGVFVCCRNNAASNVCPNSATKPYMINNIAQLCYVIGTLSNCPTGYTCQMSKFSQQNICCTGTAACPIPETATITCNTLYIQPWTGQLQTCANLASSTCPKDYSCIKDTLRGNIFLCCRRCDYSLATHTPAPPTVIPTPTVCPSGMTVAYIAGNPKSCLTYNDCPTNYYCVSSTLGQWCCTYG